MGQECNLCDGFVNFVADTDVAATVKFGAIQKHVRKLGQRGAPTDLSTLVLVQGDAVRPRIPRSLRTLRPTTLTLPHPGAWCLVPGTSQHPPELDYPASAEFC